MVARVPKKEMEPKSYGKILVTDREHGGRA
jgi:hypothetical protein